MIGGQRLWSGRIFRTPGPGCGAKCAEKAGNLRRSWRGCTGSVNNQPCEGVTSLDSPINADHSECSNALGFVILLPLAELPGWPECRGSEDGDEDIPELSSGVGISISGGVARSLAHWHGIWINGLRARSTVGPVGGRAMRGHGRQALNVGVDRDRISVRPVGHCRLLWPLS